MNTRVVALLLVSLGLQVLPDSGFAQAPQPGTDAKKLVGTWRLISITDGAVPKEYRGENPTGLIYYDDKGHMAVQIMPSRERVKYSGLPTPDQARDSLLGYTAYFGTYTVDEQRRTVTHHRTGNIYPNGLGDFVRRYEFLPNDRVILMPVESKAGLTWERVR